MSPLTTAETRANKALHPTRWGFGVALFNSRLPGAVTPHASRGMRSGLAAWAAPAPRLTASFELAAAPRVLLAICDWRIERRIPLEKRVAKGNLQFVNRLVANSRPTDLGDRMRQRRVSLGLDQAALGAILGVNWNRVSRWELGKAFPRKQYLERIEGWLGTQDVMQG